MIAAHPLDRQKLRELGEILCDLSAGRIQIDRKDLLARVTVLMVCMRDDCSSRGSGSVLDRILSIADHRLGADEIAVAAAAEILTQ